LFKLTYQANNINWFNANLITNTGFTAETMEEDSLQAKNMDLCS